MNIQVHYTGDYPCLCQGSLSVTIDGVKYNFPKCCMVSGGSCYFTENYSTPHIEYGPWEISEWPNNFPEEYKEVTLKAINSEIPLGCCGDVYKIIPIVASLIVKSIT